MAEYCGMRTWPSIPFLGIALEDPWKAFGYIRARDLKLNNRNLTGAADMANSGSFNLPEIRIT